MLSKQSRFHQTIPLATAGFRSLEIEPESLCLSHKSHLLGRPQISVQVCIQWDLRHYEHATIAIAYGAQLSQGQ